MRNFASILVPNNLEEYQKTFQQLLLGLERSGACLEELHMGSQLKVFSARTGQAGRAIFLKINIKRQKHLLYVTHLDNHEYDALTVAGLKRYLQRHTPHIEEDIAVAEFPVLSKQMASEKADTRYCAMLEHYSAKKMPLNTVVPFGRKWVTFSSDQQQACYTDTSIFVKGNPGSGKTLVIFNQMRRCIEQYRVSPTHPPPFIVYVTKSSDLIHKIQWLWDKHHGGVDTPCPVSFITLETLIKQYGGELREKVFVSEPQFKEWFKLYRHLKRSGLSQETHQKLNDKKKVDTIYPEMRTIGGCDTSAEYYQLGKKQCGFPKEVREDLYLIYQNYLKYLEEQHQFDSALIHFRLQQEFTHLFIDEGQDLALNEIRALFQATRRVLFFMDEQQRQQDFTSKEEFICKALLEKDPETCHFQFERIHRSPITIIDAVSRMNRAATLLSHGAAYKGEFAEIIPADPTHFGSYEVVSAKHISGELIEAALQPGFIAIHFGDQLPTVFNDCIQLLASEANGLEFERGLIYISKKHFLAASQELTRLKASGAVASQHRATELHTQFLLLFKLLFIALTRFEESVTVVIEDLEILGGIVAFLQDPGARAELLPVKKKEASTSEIKAAYFDDAVQFILKNLTKQARQSLEKGQFTAEEIEHFFKKYRPKEESPPPSTQAKKRKPKSIATSPTFFGTTPANLSTSGSKTPSPSSVTEESTRPLGSEDSIDTIGFEEQCSPHALESFDVCFRALSIDLDRLLGEDAELYEEMLQDKNYVIEFLRQCRVDEGDFSAQVYRKFTERKAFIEVSFHSSSGLSILLHLLKKYPEALQRYADVLIDSLKGVFPFSLRANALYCLLNCKPGQQIFNEWLTFTPDIIQHIPKHAWTQKNHSGKSILHVLCAPELYEYSFLARIITTSHEWLKTIPYDAWTEITHAKSMPLFLLVINIFKSTGQRCAGMNDLFEYLIKIIPTDLWFYSVDDASSQIDSAILRLASTEDGAQRLDELLDRKPEIKRKFTSSILTKFIPQSQINLIYFLAKYSQQTITQLLNIKKLFSEISPARWTATIEQSPCFLEDRSEHVVKISLLFWFLSTALGKTNLLEIIKQYPSLFAKLTSEKMTQNLFLEGHAQFSLLDLLKLHESEYENALNQKVSQALTSVNPRLKPLLKHLQSPCALKQRFYCEHEIISLAVSLCPERLFTPIFDGELSILWLLKHEGKLWQHFLTRIQLRKHESWLILSLLPRIGSHIRNFIQTLGGFELLSLMLDICPQIVDFITAEILKEKILLSGRFETHSVALHFSEGHKLLSQIFKLKPSLFEDIPLGVWLHQPIDGIPALMHLLKSKDTHPLFIALCNKTPLSSFNFSPTTGQSPLRWLSQALSQSPDLQLFRLLEHLLQQIGFQSLARTHQNKSLQEYSPLHWILSTPEGVRWFSEWLLQNDGFIEYVNLQVLYGRVIPDEKTHPHTLTLFYLLLSQKSKEGRELLIELLTLNPQLKKVPASALYLHSATVAYDTPGYFIEHSSMVCLLEQPQFFCDLIAMGLSFADETGVTQWRAPLCTPPKDSKPMLVTLLHILSNVAHQTQKRTIQESLAGGTLDRYSAEETNLFHRVMLEYFQKESGTLIAPSQSLTLPKDHIPLESYVTDEFINLPLLFAPSNLERYRELLNHLKCYRLFRKAIQSKDDPKFHQLLLQLFTREFIDMSLELSNAEILKILACDWRYRQEFTSHLLTYFKEFPNHICYLGGLESNQTALLLFLLKNHANLFTEIPVTFWLEGDPEAWPMYFLTSTLGGLRVLERMCEINPDWYKDISSLTWCLTPETYENQGSMFVNFCKIYADAQFESEHLDRMFQYFIHILPIEAWFEKISPQNAKTAFASLCRGDGTCGKLKFLLESASIVSHLTQTTVLFERCLLSPHATTYAYSLSQYPRGRAFLSALSPEVFEHSQSEIWVSPGGLVDLQMGEYCIRASMLYWYLSTADGRHALVLLLQSKPDLFSKLTVQDFTECLLDTPNPLNEFNLVGVLKRSGEDFLEILIGHYPALASLRTYHSDKCLLASEREYYNTIDIELIIENLDINQLFDKSFLGTTFIRFILKSEYRMQCDLLIKKIKRTSLNHLLPFIEAFVSKELEYALWFESGVVLIEALYKIYSPLFGELAKDSLLDINNPLLEGFITLHGRSLLNHLAIRKHERILAIIFNNRPDLLSEMPLSAWLEAATGSEPLTWMYFLHSKLKDICLKLHEIHPMLMTKTHPNRWINVHNLKQSPLFWLTDLINHQVEPWYDLLNQVGIHMPHALWVQTTNNVSVLHWFFTRDVLALWFAVRLEKYPDFHRHVSSEWLYKPVQLHEYTSHESIMSILLLNPNPRIRAIFFDLQGDTASQKLRQIPIDAIYHIFPDKDGHQLPSCALLSLLLEQPFGPSVLCKLLDEGYVFNTSPLHFWRVAHPIFNKSLIDQVKALSDSPEKFLIIGHLIGDLSVELKDCPLFIQCMRRQYFSTEYANAQSGQTASVLVGQAASALRSHLSMFPSLDEIEFPCLSTRAQAHIEIPETGPAK